MRKIITLCLFLLFALSLGAVSVMARGEHSGGKNADFGSSMHNRVMPGKQRLSNRRGNIREEETKVLNYLKENQPETFKSLTRLKKSNPRKYREMLRKKAKQMYFLESLKERNPEQYKRVVRMGKMDQKSRQLAEEYKKEKDPKKRAAIKAELRDQLNKLFDLKQEQREAATKKLQKELDKLQESIIQRNGSKAKIVKRRLEEITGKNYLQW